MDKPEQDHPKALYNWHKQVYDNSNYNDSSNERIDQATSSRELSSSLQQQRKEMISLNGFLMLGGDDIMHHSCLQFTGEHTKIHCGTS